jgi:hypothetical protein
MLFEQYIILKDFLSKKLKRLSNYRMIAKFELVAQTDLKVPMLSNRDDLNINFGNSTITC